MISLVLIVVTISGIVGLPVNQSNPPHAVPQPSLEDRVLLVERRLNLNDQKFNQVDDQMLYIVGIMMHQMNWTHPSQGLHSSNTAGNTPTANKTVTNSQVVQEPVTPISHNQNQNGGHTQTQTITTNSQSGVQGSHSNSGNPSSNVPRRQHNNRPFGGLVSIEQNSMERTLRRIFFNQPMGGVSTDAESFEDFGRFPHGPNHSNRGEYPLTGLHGNNPTGGQNTHTSNNGNGQSNGHNHASTSSASNQSINQPDGSMNQNNSPNSQSSTNNNEGHNSAHSNQEQNSQGTQPTVNNVDSQGSQQTSSNPLNKTFQDGAAAEQKDTQQNENQNTEVSTQTDTQPEKIENSHSEGSNNQQSTTITENKSSNSPSNNPVVSNNGKVEQKLPEADRTNTIDHENSHQPESMTGGEEKDGKSNHEVNEQEGENLTEAGLENGEEEWQNEGGENENHEREETEGLETQQATQSDHGELQHGSHISHPGESPFEQTPALLMPVEVVEER
ncbi:GATA zinc finger domain-containing protein 14-like [Patella vulgata]|uniref:GATA zinc finger domain-containing protein 14-like n=1 Tax=Patella vulgata TaxID=6465 RepID=UPI00217FE074|nr:GATA zinc finger domain-containing protein 14-like [Patella vulgata]